MGMFDDIKCEYPLPQPEEPKGFTGEIYFQTKDLECCLDKYQIREDGTLWIQTVEYEYPENVDNEDLSWGDIKLDIKEKMSRWDPVKTTRSINMHSAIDGDGEYDYWIVYEVTFLDGKVIKTDLIKFEARPNAERKRQKEEDIKKWKTWLEYTKTKRYRYIRWPYQEVVKFIISKLIRGLEKTKTALYKLEYFLLR